MPKILQIDNSATIIGQLSAGGVNSTINANFACINNTTPTGTVSGTIEFPTFAGPIRSFTFNSNNPVVASGFDSDGKESAEAIFHNVTVTEIGGPTDTDCTLVVNGTQSVSGSWDGTFVNMP